VPAGTGIPGSIAGKPDPACATAFRISEERENSVQQSLLGIACDAAFRTPGFARCRSEMTGRFV
jgi:hypothetical protein